MQEQHPDHQPAHILSSNRLRRARELRGWMREYVASQIGSDVKSVARWERGSTFPSPYYRQKLCELFHMNAEELGFLKQEQLQNEQHHVQVEPDEKVKQHEEHKQPLTNQLSPLSLNVHLHFPLVFLVFCGIIIVGSSLSAAFFFLKYLPSLSPPPPKIHASAPVLPGGEWINPANGQIVYGTIHFAARAYPTNHGDPAINHVNFTITWQGGHWQVVCIAYAFTAINDIFACSANPTTLGVPAGRVEVSFDVYDQAGNIHFAPNGEHTIIYMPGA